MYTFVVTGALHAFYKLKGTINKYRLLAFNIHIFFFHILQICFRFYSLKILNLHRQNILTDKQ